MRYVYNIRTGVKKAKTKLAIAFTTFGLLLGGGGLSMVLVGSANADSSSINFESPPYSIGNINGQDGWSKTGSYDSAVVDSTGYGFSSFGNQSLRISNGVASGSFGDQTFSKSLVNEAGESSAQTSAYSSGTRQPHFEAQFDVASTSPTQQPGLFISVSPDRGDGARMGYVGFDDQSDGVHVIFYDYQDLAPFGSLATPANGCSGSDDFMQTDIAILDRTAAHTIKISMDFVNGARNDEVKVYVDGALKHTGTSWEDYFRWCTESGGGVPNDASADVSRTVDSLLIRAGGSSVPSVLGAGYMFDNITLTSGPILVSPTDKDQCKKDGYKNFNNPTFKNQGQCVSWVEHNVLGNGNGH